MPEPPTLEDLQGEWKLISVGEDGGKAPFFIPWLMKPRLQVKGNRYAKFIKGNLVEKGRLKITPASGYSHMDERIETGEDKGKIHRGIVRWVGKKLEHLQAPIGEKRPADEPYGRESMVGYALLKRV